MKLIISVDDGDVLDYKSINILSKYGLRGLFFIPTNSYGFNHPDWYSGHEVGGHTVTHPSDLKLLSKEQQWHEIFNNKKDLEKQFEQQIVWFCPPRGRYNDQTIDCIINANYAYMRTTKVLEKRRLNGLVQNTTIHCFARREYGPMSWTALARSILVTKPKYFHLWWHSWELERYNEWNKLEELLRYITANYEYEN